MCLSVCLFFVCLSPFSSQTTGWIRTKLGMHLPLHPGNVLHILFRGYPHQGGGYNFGKTQNFENFLLLLWKKYFNYSNSNSNTIDREKDSVLEGKSLEQAKNLRRNSVRRQNSLNLNLNSGIWEIKVRGSQRVEFEFNTSSCEKKCLKAPMHMYII